MDVHGTGEEMVMNSQSPRGVPSAVGGDGQLEDVDSNRPQQSRTTQGTTETSGQNEPHRGEVLTTWVRGLGEYPEYPNSVIGVTGFLNFTWKDWKFRGPFLYELKRFARRKLPFLRRSYKLVDVGTNIYFPEDYATRQVSGDEEHEEIQPASSNGRIPKASTSQTSPSAQQTHRASLDNQVIAPEDAQPEASIGATKNEHSARRLQQVSQLPDGSSSDETLRLTPPNRTMWIAYMHDFHTRTGINKIPFGPEMALPKHNHDERVHVAHPILCDRDRLADDIVQTIPVAEIALSRRLGPTFLVVGIFSSRAVLWKETCIPILPKQDLFRTIIMAARFLRGFWRFVSLKRVAGFSVYRCDAENGHHFQVEVDMLTADCLTQLYVDTYSYSKRRQDHLANAHWKPWIHTCLNDGKYRPIDGKYSLELKLSWSPIRIVTLAITPMILSFVIGIWYMQTHEDGTEPAWVIATYIATAGGVSVAIIAAVVALSER